MTLTPWSELFGPDVTHATLVFFRVAAIISVMPGLGTPTVPVRVKLALALALSVFVSGTAALEMRPISVGLIASETLVGLVFGIGFRFLIFALQTAGTIAAQSTSLSQLLGNASVEPMPAIGHILVTAGLALMFILDLHLLWLAGIIDLYRMFPVGTVLGAADLGMWGVAEVSQAFALAFRIAVPFLILSMMYNVTLGVINKAMPQLMVAFVGAPLITFCGLAFLALGAPVMLSVWSAAVEGYLANPFGGR
ncbi:flagellar biosynthetic protein FliR [Primorskyibacter aestuariivivens]|uniref:flagellar biosynthetic protein FliR n=1 Tax=Primorskyibacter aestuariivivens TaxID=1888912 RepID=UPI002301E664|nr:flagellar biosynthetic protein FliR [Primorskyibacter aestuariivivens]MDA7430274.1 flagellar biosynthetic protein FliR [Primorskyibacter aestuariivivens]